MRRPKGLSAKFTKGPPRERAERGRERRRDEERLAENLRAIDGELGWRLKEDELRRLVLKHTAGEHQRAALELLADHIKRYVPRILSPLQCHECKRMIEGVLWTKPGPEGPAPTHSQISEIVDTWGYIAFTRSAACGLCTLMSVGTEGDGEHIKCHHCLGEGWIGDIFAAKKKAEPLLIDQLYRQCFKKPPLQNISLRQILEAARRFVLDDEMAAFWVEMVWKAFHGSIRFGANPNVGRIQRKMFARLDEFRHFARLPHKVSWIECSREAMNNTMEKIMRENELPLTQYKSDGSIRSEDFEHEKWEGTGQRRGFLLVQHEKIETAFYCTEFFNYSADNPTVNFHPAAACWQTDDDPLPWSLTEPTPWRGFNTGSEFCSGMRGYVRPNVGFRPMALGAQGMTTKDRTEEYQDSVCAGKGVLRYLWTLLATVNKIPLLGRQEVRPSHGFVAKGRYRHFLAHQIITLHVPEKVRAKVIRQTLTDVHMRAHQVRGHWRDDWKLPKGNKSIWIAEHQRGDASLGFVTHDYSVKHEADKDKEAVEIVDDSRA